MKKSYVYILKCSDQSYYTGVTNDLKTRLLSHTNGQNPNAYTFARRPLELVYYAEFTNIRLAIEKEKQLKKWSRSKKEAPINQHFDQIKVLAKKDFSIRSSSTNTRSDEDQSTE